MEHFNDILKRREEVRENILKSFDNDFEKARSGTYADTSENKKLNRVGKKYGGSGKTEEASTGKPTKKEDAKGSTSEGGKSVEDHAKGTSEETLKKVIASKDADESLKSAAKRELTSRGVKTDGDKTSEEKKESDISDSDIDAIWDCYDEGNSTKRLKEIFKENKRSEIISSLIKNLVKNSDDGQSAASKFIKNRVMLDLDEMISNSNKK